MATVVFVKTQSIDERFWSKVDRGAVDMCWLWKASTFDDGYGQFSIGRKNMHAHRLAWLLERGAIPDELFVLHTCDTPACCNPSHLYLGTNLQNQADKAARGRVAGSRNPRAVLCECAARAIRSLYADGVVQVDLAARFGVTQSMVSKIVRGTNWEAAGG